MDRLLSISRSRRRFFSSDADSSLSREDWQSVSTLPSYRQNPRPCDTETIESRSFMDFDTDSLRPPTYISSQSQVTLRDPGSEVSLVPNRLMSVIRPIEAPFNVNRSLRSSEESPSTQTSYTRRLFRAISSRSLREAPSFATSSSQGSHGQVPPLPCIPAALQEGQGVSQGRANLARNCEPETNFIIGERKTIPLVNPALLRGHLMLLREFVRLKAEIEQLEPQGWPAGTIPRDIEQRWAWFIGFAVER
jgi:hypothetical protein